MSNRFKIVHYINQFFGGIGGEDKAYMGPQIREGVIGPGMALQNALKDKGDVVATVICGDNYFSEKVDEAAQEVLQLLTPYKPDVVCAGPAFNAGRYGIACGAVCKTVQESLRIPAVTGMYEENPGVNLYREDVYIAKTIHNARGMTEAVSKMANLAVKLATNQEIGDPDEEGYIARGLLESVLSDKTAAQRAVDMLLAKLQSRPYESELHTPQFEDVRPPDAIKDLSSAKIAIVTDGGLVPVGNPDHLESENATKFGRYDVKEVLTPGKYEISHYGYDRTSIMEDARRLVPIDVMLDLEKEGVIGKVGENIYSTAGCGTPLENSRNIGRNIAEQLKTDGVDGVILTST